MTSSTERETIPQHVQAPLAEQAEAKRFDPRTQRLLLSGAGLVAVAGLGALAAFFTAPFADPADNGTGAPTSIVPPSAGKTMDKPIMTGTTASEALRRLTADASQRETPKTDAPPQAEVLAPDDPRWAKTSTTPAAEDKPPSPASAGTDEGSNPTDNPVTAAPAEGSPPGSLAAPMQREWPPAVTQPPDDPTAPMDEASPPAPSEPADGTATAAISPTEPETDPLKAAPKQEPGAPAATGAAPSSNVTVTTDVKMRAGPRDEAAVVAIIPDNAVVGLVKCESWCEVVYKGRRGFVYKNFIDGRGVAAKRAAAPTPAPVQAPATEPQAPKAEPPKAVDLNSVGR